MDMKNFIGKWGAVNLGESVGDYGEGNYKDYPFKGQYHKCIGAEKNYLIVEYSCIQIRISEHDFRLIDPPNFFPFDIVKYVSSKGKLEIGTIVSFSFKWKPIPEKVYILSVNGKVKSTLYEKERLTLIEDTLEVHKRRESLSKMISHALRYEPGEYNLDLGLGGWVNMQQLINAIKEKGSEWQSLQYFDILKMIDLSDKKRHEVKTKMIGPEYKNKYEWFIRAKYGHSIDGKIYKEKQNPPDVLYHGITSEAADKILKEGLKPMDRQYVHLSQKIEEAEQVGKRRQPKPVILKIDAKKAFEDQINFYTGNDKIWLSDFIGPDYIKVETYR